MVLVHAAGSLCLSAAAGSRRSGSAEGLLLQAIAGQLPQHMPQQLSVLRLPIQASSSIGPGGASRASAFVGIAAAEFLHPALPQPDVMISPSCRSLSLDNIITLLNAAVLEKQMVVFCPHIGTLAAVVLALVPLLRPFAWQSLMLPVTPDSMLGFLEAPVPFVLGVQYKTAAVASRWGGTRRSSSAVSAACCCQGLPGWKSSGSASAACFPVSL